ncbi:MAG: hypothetical protein ACRD6B_20740, partial [Bryobacteraceae bacterium]
VYRKQDRLYLRYVIRNNSKKNLTLAEAPRVSVTPIANSPSFVHAGQPMQIAPQRAATLPGQGGSALPLLLRESITTSLAPGASCTGIVGVRLPGQERSPLIIRLLLPAQDASPLAAAVVVP